MLSIVITTVTGNHYQYEGAIIALLATWLGLLDARVAVKMSQVGYRVAY